MVKAVRFTLIVLLIFALSACAATGNRGEDKALSRGSGDEIIFGVGTTVEKEPVPYVQDLGKRVFRSGETIGFMILVKGYVGQKIRLDFIRTEDHYTRTLISEIVPAAGQPGGAMFWWHNEKIWSVNSEYPEAWAAQLQVGKVVRRHEFVVYP